MLLAHSAICPGVILILALGTTWGLWIKRNMLGVNVRIALHTLRMKRAVDDTPVRSKAGIIEGDANVGVCPGQASMPFLGSAVFTCLVVLLTASAYRQYTAGEGNVKRVSQPRRSEPENRSPLGWAVRHIIGVHLQDPEFSDRNSRLVSQWGFV